jgi:ubiquinone/menaquinone biosynthesis C-methylase UbiE
MGKHDKLFHHGHAHKLDDPERKIWMPPEAVLARLALRPGLAVADIGAGTGYFALPIARAIAPGGQVSAVDMQPEMLDLLRERAGELPITLVQGEAARTTLADRSQDVVLVANVWHEIDDRAAALAEIARICRPGALLAILDWRPDVEQPPGPRLDHRIAPEDVAAEVAASGRFRGVTAETAGVYSYLVLASLVD